MDGPGTGVEQISFGWGLSAAADAEASAASASEQAAGDSSGVTDLAFVFASGNHAPELGSVCQVVRRRTGARHIIGITAVSTVGGRYEVEMGSSVSVLSASLPGVRVTPFSTEDLRALRGTMTSDRESDAAGVEDEIADAMGMDNDLRCTLLVADPFSVPVGQLLPRLDRARRYSAAGDPIGFLAGGMASAGSSPGSNLLVLDEQTHSGGLIGVSLSGGRLRADSVVSQGCRPVGEPLVVTRAKGNLIFELGGRPALDVAKEVLDELDEDSRRQLAGGLYLGRAVNPSKSRLGRGDFLIRRVVGVEQSSKALAVEEIVRVGMTVGFHIRDAGTAREDLELLLDGQVLHGPPAGGLLFTCNGRGASLFDESNVDAWTTQRAFLPPDAGERAAKAGSSIDIDRSQLFPLSGMFAAGEIGAIGSQSYLHGHTASLVLFRDEDDENHPAGGSSPGD
ncbi:MAG: FIST N-terminal domain-containing protein [Planctomycetota bacterium]